MAQVLEATVRTIDRIERLPVPLRERAYQMLQRFSMDFDRLLNAIEKEGPSCRLTLDRVFDVVSKVWDIDHALIFSNDSARHPTRHKARLQACNLVIILFPELTRQQVGDIFTRGDVCRDHSTISVWVSDHRKALLKDERYLKCWEECRRRMHMGSLENAVVVKQPFRSRQQFVGQQLHGDQLALLWPEDKQNLLLSESQ